MQDHSCACHVISKRTQSFCFFFLISKNKYMSMYSAESGRDLKWCCFCEIYAKLGFHLRWSTTVTQTVRVERLDMDSNSVFLWRWNKDHMQTKWGVFFFFPEYCRCFLLFFCCCCCCDSTLKSSLISPGRQNTLQTWRPMSTNTNTQNKWEKKQNKTW